MLDIVFRDISDKYLDTVDSDNVPQPDGLNPVASQRDLYEPLKVDGRFRLHEYDFESGLLEPLTINDPEYFYFYDV
jgi:hypothetical protein